MSELTEVEKFIAEQKGIPTKEILNTLLREHTVEVTFLKLDGDKRVMTCTKSTSAIPKDKLPKTETKPHEHNVTVWDINANGWRSFKYDRVQAVKLQLDVAED